MCVGRSLTASFSALQRAEIAEIQAEEIIDEIRRSFSALQRAEIAEICGVEDAASRICEGFSALQRAEIAEMSMFDAVPDRYAPVSVLFNEPKLLKWNNFISVGPDSGRFSALQRAEIAEIIHDLFTTKKTSPFQCSSTSRNC